MKTETEMLKEIEDVLRAATEWPDMISIPAAKALATLAAYRNLQFEKLAQTSLHVNNTHEAIAVQQTRIANALISCARLMTLPPYLGDVARIEDTGESVYHMKDGRCVSYNEIPLDFRK